MADAFFGTAPCPYCGVVGLQVRHINRDECNCLACGHTYPPHCLDLLLRGFRWMGAWRVSV